MAGSKSNLYSDCQMPYLLTGSKCFIQKFCRLKWDTSVEETCKSKLTHKEHLLVTNTYTLTLAPRKEMGDSQKRKQGMSGARWLFATHFLWGNRNRSCWLVWVYWRLENGEHEVVEEWELWSSQHFNFGVNTFSWSTWTREVLSSISGCKTQKFQLLTEIKSPCGNWSQIHLAFFWHLNLVLNMNATNSVSLYNWFKVSEYPGTCSKKTEKFLQNRKGIVNVVIGLASVKLTSELNSDVPAVWPWVLVIGCLYPFDF